MHLNVLQLNCTSTYPLSPTMCPYPAPNPLPAPTILTPSLAFLCPVHSLLHAGTALQAPFSVFSPTFSPSFLLNKLSLLTRPYTRQPCRGLLGRGSNEMGRGSDALGRGSHDLGRGMLKYKLSYP